MLHLHLLASSPHSPAKRLHSPAQPCKNKKQMAGPPPETAQTRATQLASNTADDDSFVIIISISIIVIIRLSVPGNSGAAAAAAALVARGGGGGGPRIARNTATGPTPPPPPPSQCLHCTALRGAERSGAELPACLLHHQAITPGNTTRHNNKVTAASQRTCPASVSRFRTAAPHTPRMWTAARSLALPSPLPLPPVSPPGAE
ncbi:hypothetical protein PLESTM_000144800 [Pleodorina starrii]|nr:hypothetical protein PLESTM_000144800 [Pleodorina starrii]